MINGSPISDIRNMPICFVGLADIIPPCGKEHY